LAIHRGYAVQRILQENPLSWNHSSRSEGWWTDTAEPVIPHRVRPPHIFVLGGSRRAKSLSENPVGPAFQPV